MTHSLIDPKLQLIFVTSTSAEQCVCNDAVPDPAVVTLDYGLSSPSFKSQQGHEAFLLPKDSDQFWCLSVLLFSEYRQRFPGIRLSGLEANHSPLLSGLYYAMCLHGRSGTTSRCFTKVYQAMSSAVPRLSVGRARSGKESFTFRSLCPLGRAPYPLQTGKLHVDCGEERIVKCS